MAGLVRGLASAALVLGLFLGVQSASASELLWISAPTWSYSAAAAASPAGAVYFWGLSVGAGSYSFAFAFSNAGALGSAAAFAEASAGLGGLGAAQAVGFADPYATFGIDISSIDPSQPNLYPETKPGSDPFSTPYTVTSTGITFSGGGQELNAGDSFQAFLYTGGTDESSLDAELGALSNSDSGTTQAGDVTDISSLTTDFGLIPLDQLIVDPGGLSGLTFTENDSSVNPADVILVGEGEAASSLAPIPEPTPLYLLCTGALGLLATLRRRATA